MTTALVLNSTARGSQSVSRQLVELAIKNLREADPDIRIIARDLDAEPLPHLTADVAHVITGGSPSNPAQEAALRLSDALIEELKAADVVVIGAPMYNFGIPSTLKSWFDYVLRAGVTFRYTEQGPIGLVGRKKVVVVESRAGFYSEGETMAMDSQEPHLRTMLGLMGLKDVEFVRVEKLAFGPEAMNAALEGARERVRQVAIPETLAA